MNGKPFLIGFMIGGAIAGISTLLTAPSSGKETRIRLKEKTDQTTYILSDIKDHLHELKQTVAVSSKEGKKVISDFIEDTKVTVSQWKQEIHPHQSQLKQELEDIEQSIKELESTIKN